MGIDESRTHFAWICTHFSPWTHSFFVYIILFGNVYDSTVELNLRDGCHQFIIKGRHGNYSDDEIVHNFSEAGDFM